MPGGGQATTQQSPFPKWMSNSKIRLRTNTFSVSGTSETPSGARAPKWQRRRAAVAPGFNFLVVGACDSLSAPKYPPLDFLSQLFCTVMTARYSKCRRVLSRATPRRSGGLKMWSKYEVLCARMYLDGPVWRKCSARGFRRVPSQYSGQKKWSGYHFS